jgi:hypothetical protein
MAVPNQGGLASLTVLEASQAFTAPLKELKRVWEVTPSSTRVTAQELADSIADLRDQVLQLAKALPGEGEFTFSELAERTGAITNARDLENLATKLDSSLHTKNGKPLLASTSSELARPTLEARMRRILTDHDIKVLEELSRAIAHEGARGARGWAAGK